ncbi:excalibur calcium-binding domain-containing protein [Nocardia australiensis]|uniref:excalibur calcium-binding domain-containing protein n=1 Tax=Nocardia australiensis TaxID=2887191 RepID=UPI0027DF321A|nr:excalibur calcium-binding domain-containing protein [Nocardia australiensis]
MNISVIHRHGLAALSAACLMAGAMASAPTASADSPSATRSGPDDSLPIPSYRPGPKGDNVPPPETTEQEPAYYTNCDQVRAEGKLPLYLGQPGYAPYLDPDGDGVACDY